jgi:molybdopterin-guanine dinucleotide biosynthesis protein A
MDKACFMHRELRNVYKIVVRKPAGRRPLGRSMCMREDNIKIDFEENGIECVLDSNGSQKGPVAGWLFTR